MKYLNALLQKFAQSQETGLTTLPEGVSEDQEKFPHSSERELTALTKGRNQKQEKTLHPGKNALTTLSEGLVSVLSVPPNRGAEIFAELPAADVRVTVAPAFATPDYELVTEPAQLERVLPRLLEAPLLGLDTETTGLDPLTDTLRLIQIATPTQTIVIDAYTCPLQMLAPLFSQEREVLFHNAIFDLRFLAAAGLPWPGRIFDTILANQLLHAGNPEGRLNQSSLSAVVQRFLGLTLRKEEQRSCWDGTLSREQMEYAAILLPLAEKIKQESHAAGLERVVSIENRCVVALAWLELAGLPIDTERWLSRATKEEERASILEAQLHALADRNGTPVNWRSSAQVLQVLRSRGHQIDATDSATLTALLEDPLVRTLLEYRDARIRTGTFGRKWLKKHQHLVTGRIHASYLQCGAEAGRMSCSRPNVQNIPRSAAYRSCIRPEEGRVIVKADFSQIELRIAAVIANDAVMLAAFREGQDLHAVTASKVLGVPLDQVGKEHRQLAKSLNFGLIYGMGARRLRAYAASSYKVVLTHDEAERHKRAFFRTYPAFYRWHRLTAARLARQQRLETRTLPGRRRLAVDRYTNALNSPVQGTGADGLKLALTRLFEHRHEVPEAKLVACVHDEIVAECPQEDAQQTAAWLTRHMTAAMEEIVGDAVPIEVETTIGRDWAGAKE